MGKTQIASHTGTASLQLARTNFHNKNGCKRDRRITQPPPQKKSTIVADADP
jgi:hypothetical protein